MRKHPIISILILMAVIFSATAAAQTPAGSSDQEVVRNLVVGVKGETPKEDTLALAVSVGDVVTRTVRIYSEPSHTLLFVGIDGTYAKTKEGSDWKEMCVLNEKPLAVITSNLPGAQPLVMIPARPEKDERIAVWVDGDVGNGVVGERLIADALLYSDNEQPKSFGFSIYVKDGGARGPTGPFTWCCSSGACREMCEECDGYRFTCCLSYSNCCRIECGWIYDLCLDCGP